MWQVGEQSLATERERRGVMENMDIKKALLNYWRIWWNGKLEDDPKCKTVTTVMLKIAFIETICESFGFSWGSFPSFGIDNA